MSCRRKSAGASKCITCRTSCRRSAGLPRYSTPPQTARNRRSSLRVSPPRTVARSASGGNSPRAQVRQVFQSVSSLQQAARRPRESPSLSPPRNVSRVDGGDDSSSDPGQQTFRRDMTEQQFFPGRQATRSGLIQQIITHCPSSRRRRERSGVYGTHAFQSGRARQQTASLNRSRQSQPAQDAQAAQSASKKPRTADRDVSSLRAPRELPQRGTQSNPTVAYRIDQTQVRFSPESIPYIREETVTPRPCKSHLPAQEE
jgi:hypothetical protein